jgi:serine/threonine-protein kinase
VGTPTYMSPEQIRGDKLTSKSDLFSAGIVTYELYTGINPFIGKDVNDTLNKIISWDEDKLSDLSSTLPVDIQNLIIGLLHNDPEQRIEDASKVIEILTNKTGGRGYRIRKKKKNIKKYVIIPSLLFIFLVVILIKQYYYPPTSKTIINTRNDTLTINKLDEQRGINKSDHETYVRKEELKPLLTIPIADEKTAPVINQEKTIQVPLIKKTGSLFVECLPWAYVYIDSAETDLTPLQKNLVLTEGEHLLQLIHPNFPIYTKKVRIRENGLTSIKINLDTLFAYLDCKVNPWGEIYIDGKLKGQTPLQSPIRIIPGEHHILLKNSEFEPKEYDIKTGQGQTYTIKYNFKK